MPRVCVALYLDRRSIEGRWKLIMLNTSRFPDGRVQLRPSFTFTPDKFELYDLLDEPHEAKSLASMHPQRVTELRRHIEEWSADQ